MILTGCLIIGTILCSSTNQIPLPKLVIPEGLGVNIHFTGEPKDLDLIAEGGFRFIRMDFAWGGIEREKGVYNFKSYDELTEGCAKRGIRILYILDYSNKLYESDQSVRTPEGRKAFAEYAATAAKRYAGKGILWEVWNEPNLKQFWTPQPSIDDYCALVEAIAAPVKEADPSGTFIAPATSGIPMEWLEGCFKNGLLKWIDALSVHPYRPHPPETVMGDYAKLRELIKRYAPEGKEIPIISGEWGYSIINWDKNRLSEEQQARYLVRMYLTNLLEGVSVNIWYDWKDDGTDPNEREHHFGTVTHDLKPKMAYLAAKTLAHNLEGYSIDSRIDLGENKDMVLKLKNSQKEAIAFWTMDEDHEIKLPIQSGKGILLNMTGDKQEISWGNDGLKITLSQNPQYLILQ